MIQINNVSKIFSGFLLKNINLSIASGEFIGILGQSGSGKSTLLNLIAGLDEGFSGEIKIDGKKPSHIIKNREISMVFQDSLLLPHLNVFDNIAFGLKIQKISKFEIEKRVFEAISEMELTGKEKRFPNELSGGEKQRVSIARALVTKPKLLLMDEPFSALDFNLRERMQKLVKSLHKKYKISTIFVTHDRDEAFFLADRIAVMSGGELLEFDTPQALYYNPKTLYTAKLLGIENILSKKDFEGIFGIRDESFDFIAFRGNNLCIVQNSDLTGIIEDIQFGLGKYCLTILIGDIKLYFIQEKEPKEKIGDFICFLYNKNNEILIKGE